MKVEILLPDGTFEKTNYRLLEPLELCGFKVPEGFVSDGASVPRVFWSLFPPVGRYFLAAVLHDYLLVIGHPWMKANKIFLAALRAQKVAKIPRYSMYAAVVVYMAGVRLTRKLMKLFKGKDRRKESKELEEGQG